MKPVSADVNTAVQSVNDKSRQNNGDVENIMDVCGDNNVNVVNHSHVGKEVYLSIEGQLLLRGFSFYHHDDENGGHRNLSSDCDGTNRSVGGMSESRHITSFLIRHVTALDATDCDVTGTIAADIKKNNNGHINSIPQVDDVVLNASDYIYITCTPPKMKTNGNVETSQLLNEIIQNDDYLKGNNGVIFGKYRTSLSDVWYGKNLIYRLILYINMHMSGLLHG